MRSVLRSLVVIFLCSLTSFDAQAYGPYDVIPVRVKDGDTVLIAVDLWPGLTKRINVRLSGINAPEVRTRQACQKRLGLQAKAALEKFLDSGPVVLSTIDWKSTKYAGRINGDLTVNGVSASQWMLQHGYAVPYHGGHRSRLWNCK